MSKWTHPICEEDFQIETGQYPDTAARVVDPEVEICCFCGRATNSGIYIRQDPNTLVHCNHDLNSIQSDWSDDTFSNDT